MDYDDLPTVLTNKYFFYGRKFMFLTVQQLDTLSYIMFQ